MRDAQREIPRSRGALSGLLLILLGLWGALIPFVGPYVNFAYDPNIPWTWTPARGWLEVLPGVVTVLGGLLLLGSRHRATALFGGWLAVIAGAWFVVGRIFATPWGLGDFGAPVPTTQAGIMALELTFYSGLGAVILWLGGMALGRLSVISVRDIQYAQPVDEYHHAESRRLYGPEYERMADADVIAHERAEVPAEPGPQQRQRGWFGGSRRHHPVPH